MCDVAYSPATSGRYIMERHQKEECCNVICRFVDGKASMAALKLV
jgi:hypothetical protein